MRGRLTNIIFITPLFFVYYSAFSGPSGNPVINVVYPGIEVVSEVERNNGIEPGVFPDAFLFKENFHPGASEKTGNQMEVSVYNVFGEILFTGKYVFEGGRMAITPELPQKFPAGLYLISIESGGSASLHKLIVK